MGRQSGYYFPCKLSPGCFYKAQLMVCKPLADNKNPFFGFPNEDSTVKSFLDCIARSSLEDASAYISKNRIGQIDLQEIKSLLNTGQDYKYLIKASAGRQYGNCKINSVLIINEKCRNDIIHLHLIHEPDMFGRWKIYRIDKE